VQDGRVSIEVAGGRIKKRKPIDPRFSVVTALDQSFTRPQLRGINSL